MQIRSGKSWQKGYRRVTNMKQELPQNGPNATKMKQGPFKNDTQNGLGTLQEHPLRNAVGKVMKRVVKCRQTLRIH